MFLFFIGLVCLLLVIGAFTPWGSVRFAVAALVVLGALAFVGFVIMLGGMMIKYH